MLIGYARTSTVDQEAGFESQIRDLGAAGCEKLFAEKVSEAAPREQLALALDYCRSGDVLMVTRLDRLARSIASSTGNYPWGATDYWDGLHGRRVHHI
jgi:DNA invertase Pin-like site-specific DNA recombinase